MARHSKPWYRKDRKSWFVTINRSRHNLGPDKGEAYKQFYRLMKQPQTRKVSQESLVAIVDEFLEWNNKNRSIATYEAYRYRLQRFCFKYPDLLVAHLRPYHVEKWVDSYPDLSKTTRRNYFRSVKRCMRWALQQGYIEENPVAHLEVPAGERRETFLKPEEFERLLTFVRNDTFCELIKCCWETGCRPQEILRVEARHVDLENQRWVIPLTEAKMKRAPRIVYLPDFAFETTQRLRQTNPEGKLFRNKVGKP